MRVRLLKEPQIHLGHRPSLMFHKYLRHCQLLWECHLWTLTSENFVDIEDMYISLTFYY